MAKRKKKVDLERAAEEVQAHLLPHPWLVTVGVNADSKLIIVYATNRNKAVRDFPKRDWKGYEIRIKRCGKPRPA